MKNANELIARLFLGHIFILAGLSKIGGYDATSGYMEAMGVPSMLLPLVIAGEALGGLAIVLGFKTRLAALGLALFSIASALIFHSNFDDQMQSILFMKNISMAGGLLLLVQYGAGALSLDKKLGH